ncbi:MAG: PaaI family thioesterase [Christensenellales bacterium]
MKVKVVKKQSNSKMCIICGMDNEASVKAQFYEMENGYLCSLFTFRDIHQSYPERVHGGMITSMLDELVGRVLWVKEPNTYAVTTQINVRFKKPVPYNEQLKGVAYITKNSSRLYEAVGEIRDMDNNILAVAEATYMKMPIERICTKPADAEMCYLIDDDIKEIDI